MTFGEVFFVGGLRGLGRLGVRAAAAIVGRVGRVRVRAAPAIMGQVGRDNLQSSYSVPISFL